MQAVIDLSRDDDSDHAARFSYQQPLVLSSEEESKAPNVSQMEIVNGCNSVSLFGSAAAAINEPSAQDNIFSNQESWYAMARRLLEFQRTEEDVNSECKEDENFHGGRDKPIPTRAAASKTVMNRVDCLSRHEIENGLPIEHFAVYGFPDSKLDWKLRQHIENKTRFLS